MKRKVISINFNDVKMTETKPQNKQNENLNSTPSYKKTLELVYKKE